MYLKYCNMQYQDDVWDYDVFAHAKHTGQLPFDQVHHAGCTALVGTCRNHVCALVHTLNIVTCVLRAASSPKLAA